MTRVSMLSTSPTPITGGAALAALPALAQFDFPVAMIASELTVDGRVRTLVEAGQIDEVFPFASVTRFHDAHGRRGDDPGKALLEQEVGLGAGAVSGEDAGDAARGDLIWARRQSGDGDEEGDPQQPDGHREGAAVHEQRASAGQRDPAVSGGPGAHRRLSRPFRLGAFRLRALRLRRLVSG